MPAALPLRIDTGRVLLLLLPTALDREPIGLRLELVPEGQVSRLVTTLGVEPGTAKPTRLAGTCGSVSATRMSRLRGRGQYIYTAPTSGAALLAWSPPMPVAALSS